MKKRFHTQELEMDDERKAHLQQLANDCSNIAYRAFGQTPSGLYSNEERGMVVGRLAATLLENELRREKEGLREA